MTEHYAAFATPLMALNVTHWQCAESIASLGVKRLRIEIDKAQITDCARSAYAFFASEEPANRADKTLGAVWDFLYRKGRTKPDEMVYWWTIACEAALGDLQDAQRRGTLEFNTDTLNIALFAQMAMMYAHRRRSEQQAHEGWVRQIELTNLQQETNRTLNQANAQLSPFAKMGEDFSRSQSDKATKPRGKILPDGTPMKQVLEGIANSAEFFDFSAKERWPHLFSALEDREGKPSEDANSDDIKKHFYTYRLQNDRMATIKFGSFEVMMSLLRSKN